MKVLNISSASRGELWTPTRALPWAHGGGGFKAALRRHVQKILDSYVRCLCSILKVKPTILWWL